MVSFGWTPARAPASPCSGLRSELGRGGGREGSPRPSEGREPGVKEERGGRGMEETLLPRGLYLLGRRYKWKPP